MQVITNTLECASRASTMPAKGIPEVVSRLVAERIDSVPELEAILLLRNHRSRAWTPEDAAQRLYVSSSNAAQILAALVRRGILKRNHGHYRYAPEDEQLEAAIDELAAAYASELIALTHMIHAKPSRSIREFADAFRFRKGK